MVEGCKVRTTGSTAPAKTYFIAYLKPVGVKQKPLYDFDKEQFTDEEITYVIYDISKVQK